MKRKARTMRTAPMKWHGLATYPDNACAHCGKALNPKRMYAVHVINGGSSVLHPDDEHLYVADNADMGCHMVGPECRKKFGEFAFKWL